jgi:hypothetical protein
MPAEFDPHRFINYLVHNQKEVLYIDFSSCETKDETIKLLKTSAEYYQKSPHALLTLTNADKAKGSKEFMDLAKVLNKEVFDEKTEKGAIIGVHGLKRVLLQGYNLIAKQKLIPFESKEEALDYLTG